MKLSNKRTGQLKMQLLHRSQANRARLFEAHRRWRQMNKQTSSSSNPIKSQSYETSACFRFQNSKKQVAKIKSITNILKRFAYLYSELKKCKTRCYGPSQKSFYVSIYDIYNDINTIIITKNLQKLLRHTIKFFHIFSSYKND